MTDIGIEQIYLYLGVFSTVLFALKLAIFMFAGGNFEVETDFDSITETDTSFNFLSVQSLLAFFMGFSWTGLTAITQIKTGEILSILIAIAVGLLFMFGTAYLMFAIKKLDHRPVADLTKAVGTEGKAYTEFKPHGEGQIQVDINNKFVTVDAISICEEQIAAFSQIRIEKVENNKLYINKI